MLASITNSGIIRAFVGARNTSASGNRARKIRGLFVSPFSVGCESEYNRACPNRLAALQRFLAPDTIEKLQGDTKMRATKPKPTSTLKPKFKSIPGALSLYRVGDVIAFDLNGVEFEASIDCVELKPGRTVLWVTPTVGVHPEHVKRVERRAS
jgi:hypothetical protein